MPQLNIHVLATVCDWRQLPSAIGCYTANRIFGHVGTTAQWTFICKQMEMLVDVVVEYWQQT